MRNRKFTSILAKGYRDLVAIPRMIRYEGDTKPAGPPPVQRGGAGVLLNTMGWTEESI